MKNFEDTRQSDATQTVKNDASFVSFDGSFDDRLTGDYFASAGRSFTGTIAATHRHFWNPEDSRYIDFSIPFDVERSPIMPFSTVPELCSDLRNELSERQQVAFANDSLHWWLSGFLFGEQGALWLSLSLADMLGNPDGVEYVVNQAREEARHVAAFTRYIETRWGPPLPVAPAFRQLLGRIVNSDTIHRKLIGMQILVEGLAMGFMASLYNKAADPVLVRLAQLVMTDETFHHKAGHLWAENDLPRLSAAERADAEDWALECFQALMFNVFNPSQKTALYEKYGWDTEYVRQKIRAYYTEEVRKQELSEQAGVFRILARTLIRSGIVTERTRPVYAQWLDLDSLAEDDTNSVEASIARQGLELIASINC